LTILQTHILQHSIPLKKNIRQTETEHLVLYKAALLVFFFSLLIDTGSEIFNISGIPIPMFAGSLVILVGLFQWHYPRDIVIAVMVCLIFHWVVWQWVFDAGFIDGVRILYSLLFAIVIGGNDYPLSFARYQIKILFITILLLLSTFYIGLWHEVPGGRITFGDFGSNAIAFILAVGFFTGLFIVWDEKGMYQKTALVSLPLFLLPIWLSGSRKIMLLIAISILVTGYFIGKGKRLIIAILILYILFCMYELTLFDPILDKIHYQLIENPDRDTFENSVKFRMNLINKGLAVFSEKPFFGYGMGAPHSSSWLAEYIGITSNDGSIVMTHNGLLDYLLMGGLYLFSIFMILYARVMWRLKSILQHAESDIFKLSILMIALNILFLGLVSFGDIFSKMGWWIFGLSLYLLRNIETQHQNDESSSGRLIS